MTTKPLNNYRARLVQARSTLGKSAREMAAALLTSRSTYQQWEAGTRRTPGIAVLAAEMLVSRKDRPGCGDRPRDKPQLSSLGEKILAVQRPDISYLELAELCGVKLSAIYKAVYRLRRLGIPVPVKLSTRGPRQARERNEERAKRIIAAIKHGVTLREIAADEHITHQRVAQIADKMGGKHIRASARAEREAAKQQSEQQKRLIAEAKRREIERLHSGMRERVAGGMSIAKAGSALGLTRSQSNTIAQKLQLGSLTGHPRAGPRSPADGTVKIQPSGFVWSPDCDAKLIAEWSEKPASAIARKLGITRNSVIGRAARLGLRKEKDAHERE